MCLTKSSREILIEFATVTGNKNSKVFEQKGDLLNFKANIDPMTEPS